jgi:hypothetical protein
MHQRAGFEPARERSEPAGATPQAPRSAHPALSVFLRSRYDGATLWRARSPASAPTARPPVGSIRTNANGAPQSGQC